MNKFHWTMHVHSTIGAIYPVSLLLYNNIFKSSIYEKYFINNSGFKTPEQFLQLLENQISNISNARLKPIRNSKLSVVLENTIEPETVGSFSFTSGVLFKFSTRLVLDNAKEILNKFPNFNSIIGYNKNFLDSSKISEDKLQKIILTNNAKNFIINREIHKADSIGQTLVPASISMFVFLGTTPLLSLLNKLIATPISLCFVLILSASIIYFVVRSFYKYRNANFDKLSYSTNSELLKGCEEYLLKCLELGKMLRTLNGPDSEIGKQFAENGDYLLDNLKYSERLRYLNNYITEENKKNKQLKTNKNRRTFKKQLNS